MSWLKSYSPRNWLSLAPSKDAGVTCQKNSSSNCPKKGGQNITVCQWHLCHSFRRSREVSWWFRLCTMTIAWSNSEARKLLRAAWKPLIRAICSVARNQTCSQLMFSAYALWWCSLNPNWLRAITVHRHEFLSQLIMELVEPQLKMPENPLGLHRSNRFALRMLGYEVYYHQQLTGGVGERTVSTGAMLLVPKKREVSWWFWLCTMTIAWTRQLGSP